MVIVIDEGYGGNRANILALDVLYPEVCKLKIISHQASIMCMKLIICLISNEQGIKREKQQSTYYVENVICPDCYLCLCNEMIHG